MVFRPKGSFGWVWLVGLGVLLMASAAFSLTAESNPPLVVWLIELSIAGLGVYFIALAVMFPTMRYEVGEGELRLRYGPMTWRVPLASIRKVKRTDLQWTVWSSMRFPGFALFNVPYGSVGTVRMCATRATTGVLLIDTDDGRFGVTPADEEAFLGALGRPATDAATAAEDRRP